MAPSKEKKMYIIKLKINVELINIMQLKRVLRDTDYSPIPTPQGNCPGLVIVLLVPLLSFPYT